MGLRNGKKIELAMKMYYLELKEKKTQLWLLCKKLYQ
jgi:hypothetical protein